MILCEKCNNFIFPDGEGFGCDSPSVISCFMNFCRLRKCKYYRKITYSKMLKATKDQLNEIDSYIFRYRDIKYPRKVSKFTIHRIKSWIQTYIEYRDYLFSINDQKQEVKNKNG